MPAKLAEWGMTDELWATIENKRNLMRLVNKNDESLGRARIKLLGESGACKRRKSEESVQGPGSAEAVAEVGEQGAAGASKRHKSE